MRHVRIVIRQQDHAAEQNIHHMRRATILSVELYRNMKTQGASLALSLNQSR